MVSVDVRHYAYLLTVCAKQAFGLRDKDLLGLTVGLVHGSPYDCVQVQHASLSMTEEQLHRYERRKSETQWPWGQPPPDQQ